MADSFFTISAVSEGLYKDKGSKFLSFAIPVSSVEDIKPIIDDYRKRYYDARHVCYAYMLGAERLVFRANDDGEPSGTAGRPILGQINSYNLTNILIVVVRYFGGILLGTSGLIVAYKEAARDAIENNKIIECQLTKEYKIGYGYDLVNEVMRIIKDCHATVEGTEYDNDRQIQRIIVEQAQAAVFESKIDKLIVYGLKRF